MFRNPFLRLERQFRQLSGQLGFRAVFLGFLLACAPILTAQDQPAQPDTSQQKINRGPTRSRRSPE